MEKITINGNIYIPIGSKGFVVSFERYENYGRAFFWTAQKADLTVSQQNEFGPQIEQLLINREKLQREIDNKGAVKVLEGLLQTPNAKQASSANWQEDVPEIFRKVDSAQLFVPAKNLGMLINAAKADKVNGGYSPDLITLCVEDASHYEDGVRGVFMMSCYRDGFLASEDRKKIWDEEKDKKIPAILRYNGFSSAQFPTDEIGILGEDGQIQPIDRIIFESSFDGINAAKYYNKAIAANHDPYKFGGTTAYYPKTESPEDIALISKILAARDAATGLPQNASKIALVLEDTKQMVLLEEALYAGRGRIVMVSFGRYDAVDANIFLHRADTSQVPPGPDSMSIKTAPAMYQEGRMVQVLSKHGVVIVGGMADMVRDDNPQIEAASQQKVTDDKKREALQGATASWCSSPYQVQYVQMGLKSGRQENEKILKDCGKTNLHKCQESNYSVKQIVEFPKGPITEEEINRFIVRKGLEFFEGYIRGIGCVPIRDLTSATPNPLWATMDDFATGGRFQGMFAWVTAKHGAKMLKADGSEVTITPALYLRKLEEAINAIEENYYKNITAKGQKASAASFAESKYPQAAFMFMECINAPHCPSTVKDEHSWPAYLIENARPVQAQLYLHRQKRIRSA